MWLGHADSRILTVAKDGVESMKRGLCLALVLLLTFSVMPALAESQPAFVVGSLTRMNGSFFTDMWGNNTADLDVRAMLHGYATVAWTYNGDYQFDPNVVLDANARRVNGGTQYTIQLARDLTYCDGTPITARDYVFSILLQSAPQITDLGGEPVVMNHLVGYEDFQQGETFTGVRLVDDYTFSLTIRRQELPYFYELALLNVTPYPIHVLAPGCEVRDDGRGAYLYGKDALGNDLFTSALLRETILDPEKGYQSHPAVTSGPYQLQSYDAEQAVATFVLNPKYKGNFEGQRPVIEPIRFQQVNNATMLDELLAGTLDLINKVSVGAQQTRASQLNGESRVSVFTYPRSGFNFISFACEQPVTGSLAVRKAVAYCIDAQALCDGVFEGYAMPVYGYYGLGQWMTQQDAQALVDNLDHYEFDLASAIDVLEEDGWVLNGTGGNFDPAVDTVRYQKQEDGTLLPLVLKWAKMADNEISTAIEEMLAINLPRVGVELRVTEMTFDQVLQYYYREADRSDYNMFQLGSNFQQAFDPYFAYHTDDAYQGNRNTTGLRDEKLMKLADEMRATEVGDNESYYDAWMEFQEYYATVIPAVPICSNVYMDVTTPRLADYNPNSLWSWASAILYAHLN